MRSGFMNSFLVGGRFVGIVGKLERSSPATAMVFFMVVGNFMGDNLIALVFIAKKLLQSDHGADDKSDFTDNEGLEGQKSKTTKSYGDQSCSFQFQEQ
jgi:hypothetical protein